MNRFAFITLILAAMALSTPSRGVEDGFGPCALDSKHAKIPVVEGLPYEKARKKIIAAGWKPRTKTPVEIAEEMPRVGLAADLWKRGYHELVECAGTGAGPCILDFVDKAGNRLRVFTVHVYTVQEAVPKPLLPARVNVAELECPK
jgi:hypothetical protein